MRQVTSFKIFLRDHKPKMNAYYPFLSQDQIFSKLRQQWKQLKTSKPKPNNKLVKTKMSSNKLTRRRRVCDAYVKFEPHAGNEKLDVECVFVKNDDNFALENLYDDSNCLNNSNDEFYSSDSESPFMKNKFAIDSLNSRIHFDRGGPFKNSKFSGLERTYSGRVFELKQHTQTPKIISRIQCSNRAGILRTPCKDRRNVHGSVSFSSVDKTVNVRDNFHDDEGVLNINKTETGKANVNSGSRVFDKMLLHKIKSQVVNNELEANGHGCRPVSEKDFVVIERQKLTSEKGFPVIERQKLTLGEGSLFLGSVSHVLSSACERTATRFSERLEKLTPYNSSRHGAAFSISSCLYHSSEDKLQQTTDDNAKKVAYITKTLPNERKLPVLSKKTCAPSANPCQTQSFNENVITDELNTVFYHKEETLKDHHRKETQKSIHKKEIPKDHHRKETQESIHKKDILKDHHRKETQESIHKKEILKDHHRKETQESIHKKEIPKDHHRKETQKSIHKKEIPKDHLKKYIQKVKDYQKAETMMMDHNKTELVMKVHHRKTETLRKHLEAEMLRKHRTETLKDHSKAETFKDRCIIETWKNHHKPETLRKHHKSEKSNYHMITRSNSTAFDTKAAFMKDISYVEDKDLSLTVTETKCPKSVVDKSHSLRRHSVQGDECKPEKLARNGRAICEHDQTSRKYSCRSKIFHLPATSNQSSQNHDDSGISKDNKFIYNEYNSYNQLKHPQNFCVQREAMVVEKHANPCVSQNESTAMRIPIENYGLDSQTNEQAEKTANSCLENSWYEKHWCTSHGQNDFISNMADQTRAALLQAIKRLKNLSSQEKSLSQKLVHESEFSGNVNDHYGDILAEKKPLSDMFQSIPQNTNRTVVMPGKRRLLSSSTKETPSNFVDMFNDSDVFF